MRSVGIAKIVEERERERVARLGAFDQETENGEIMRFSVSVHEVTKCQFHVSDKRYRTFSLIKRSADLHRNVSIMRNEE